MTFGEIYDPIRGRIDYPAEIKPKSDRLLVPMVDPAQLGLILRRVILSNISAHDLGGV